MACGDQIDFMFPLEADIFYPITEQGAYGTINKQWVLDRAVGCNLTTSGSALQEDVKPNVNITQSLVLVGRVRGDIRISERDSSSGLTDIVISNIRDKNCNEIYIETSGIRKGKSTIFEIASYEPFVGPFGNVEYYKLVVRRSENQAADV